MNKLKNKKGITLIALVITIVVLLILAGVSIAMLTGDNGILTKASSAKEKTLESQELEQIQLAYLAATTNTTREVDKEVLYEDLKKITPKLEGLPETKDDELPWYIEGTGGQEYVITKEEVKKYVSAKTIAKNPELYYGKQVINYKANDSDTNVYRIFYVDEAGDFGKANTVYLKADYSGNYNLSSYALYDSTNTKVRQMNPDWANSRGDSEKDSEGNITWEINEQAAAYLCSPVNSSNVSTTLLPWKNYFNAQYADYVIGSPSVEMYVKSYNQVPHTPDNEFSAEYSATYSPGYIYKVNGTAQNGGYYTNENTLDYSATYNSMYCGNNGSKKGWWWLASPASGASTTMCSVMGSRAYFNCGDYLANDSVSPLVSLKSDFPIQVAE